MGLRHLASILVLATAVIAYRLPRTVVPVSYDIALNLSAAAFTAASDEYTGIEIIQIRTTEDTNQISLHAAHDFITFNSVFLNNDEITNIAIDNTTDIVTLTSTTPIPAGATRTLFIDFTSRLSTQDMYGFYKSSYVDANGITKYLATTQFQPVYARRAFPCFDEPSFKATFAISITKPEGMNALCNMPGEFHDTSDIVGNDPNQTTTAFSPTEVMPTYLVAFIVSEFTCTDGQNVEGTAVPYRICSRPETNSTRTWAVDIGPPLLRSLNNFTNYTYGSMGFPKMDQVAIPDFAAGAMENWGLVTYREQYLLWDPIESTNQDLQFIATIISHEFAHMWWGNLVTMDWWSETFLNEGFATYFQYFTTHDVQPEWELDKQFVVRVVQAVLASDSLESSQALQSPANSDAEVMSRFSQVTYLKGGSIFRMVEHVLGTENFIQGLRSYLSTYAFLNTLPENLWTSLDAALVGDDRARLPDGTTLGQVMENWVTQPGYPLINVNQVNESHVVISQEGRFLLNAENTTSRWYVPISYSTSEDNFTNTLAQEWLLPFGELEIPLVNQSWIILNNQATGFYRVNYNNLWNTIASTLKTANFAGIPEVNRAQVVDDAFQLSRSGRLNYSQLFDIIDFLRLDTSHHAWFPALSGFNFLLGRIGQDSPLGRAVAQHELDLLSNIYSTVPWTNLDDNNHAYTLKQVDVLTVACRLGLTPCVNHALERFGDFRISGERPRKNLRSIVYCTALRHSSTPALDWNLLWAAFVDAEVASEKVRILSALGCTEDQQLLERYLQWSLEGASGIRPQDALSVFTSVYSGSTVGVNIAFKFLQQNHQLIEERYQSLNALRSMITGLAERFTTQSQLEELEAFISNSTLHEDFHQAASAALATAQANQVWLNQHWDELHQYFNVDPNATTTESTPSSSPNTTTGAPPDNTTPDGASTMVTSALLILFSVVLALLNK